jgi:hypothetical protein
MTGKEKKQRKSGLLLWLLLKEIKDCVCGPLLFFSNKDGDGLKRAIQLTTEHFL